MAGGGSVAEQNGTKSFLVQNLMFPLRTSVLDHVHVHVHVRACVWGGAFHKYQWGWPLIRLSLQPPPCI